MNEKFEIFYIRHADTGGASYEDRDTCDVNITELGEKQAELLAERMSGYDFDACFSSPLLRCVRTAAPTLSAMKNKPVLEIIPELLENGSTPGYHGAGIEYLKKFYPNCRMCPDVIVGNEKPDFKCATDEENDFRAAAIVKYFRERFAYGQRILVFSHGSFGNHFIPACVNEDSREFIMSINHTSVTKIKYTSDGDIRISFMNDFSHLRPLMKDYEMTV